MDREEVTADILAAKQVVKSYTKDQMKTIFEKAMKRAPLGKCGRLTFGHLNA